MCIKQFLSEQDYRDIIQQAFLFTKRDRLVEYLTDLYNHNKEHNKKFWPYLSTAFSESRNITDDQAEYIENNNFTYDWDKEDLQSPCDIYVFLSHYIGLAIQNEIDTIRNRNRKFSMQSLPKAISKLGEYEKTSILKRKFTPQIALYSNWIKRDVYNCINSFSDIDNIPAETLESFAQIYFSNQISSQTAPEVKGCLSYLDEKNNYQTYQSFNRIVLSVCKLVFNKGYNNYKSKYKSISFSAFMIFEKNRWSELKTKIGAASNSFQIITDYIKNLHKLTTKDIESKYSFGINASYHSALVSLAKDLQLECPFLSNNTPKDFADLLTTNNYTETDRVYFGVETTTLCYILDRISKTWSNSMPTFFSLAIDKSVRFYIPKIHKPFENSTLTEFRPLLSKNYRQSLERYIGYSMDTTRERLEARHKPFVDSILKKHGLL